jgi:hypothetical protein
MRPGERLPAPRQTKIPGSRRVFWIPAKPWRFAGRPPFHSASEDRYPAGSSLVAVPRPFELPPTRPILRNKRLSQTCSARLRTEIAERVQNRLLREPKLRIEPSSLHVILVGPGCNPTRVLNPLQGSAACRRLQPTLRHQTELLFKVARTEPDHVTLGCLRKIRKLPVQTIQVQKIQTVFWQKC